VRKRLQQREQNRLNEDEPRDSMDICCSNRVTAVEFLSLAIISIISIMRKKYLKI